jgi:hypothetical protein
VLGFDGAGYHARLADAALIGTEFAHNWGECHLVAAYWVSVYSPL